MCSSIVLTYRNVITGAVFVGNTLCSWFLMILTTPTPHDKAAKHNSYNASVLTSWYILFKYFKECTVYNNLDLLKFFERKSGGALACSRALKQHKYPYVSFVCTFIPLLSFQSFLSLFGLLFSFVSVAVWIISFVRFCRGLDYYFRLFLSLFGLLFSFVSVAVWIIIFVRFCRCLNYYFRSFLSLFGPLFSFVLIAVWISIDYKILQRWS